MIFKHVAPCELMMYVAVVIKDGKFYNPANGKLLGLRNRELVLFPSRESADGVVGCLEKVFGDSYRYGVECVRVDRGKHYSFVSEHDTFRSAKVRIPFIKEMGLFDRMKYFMFSKRRFY